MKSLRGLDGLAGFQHTAARRRLDLQHDSNTADRWFQHTAARRRLGLGFARLLWCSTVSTHSRPKAAGNNASNPLNGVFCFNTQPPEGGWVSEANRPRTSSAVSTHSRPKAAGLVKCLVHVLLPSFNTQPPEGGWPRTSSAEITPACFNTQPPEGGWPPVIRVMA